MRVRAADQGDSGFVLEMLREAFNWDGERFSLDEIMQMESTAKYLAGWPNGDDFGLVAEDAGTSVGAVWARALPADAPGYGYVADDIPEIGMAVRATHRGRGIGALLMRGCLEHARMLGWRALSLSVEDGNTRARRLYEQFGFVVVGREGGSDVMLLQL